MHCADGPAGQLHEPFSVTSRIKTLVLAPRIALKRTIHTGWASISHMGANASMIRGVPPACNSVGLRYMPA
jgi:hypothetical protein